MRFEYTYTQWPVGPVAGNALQNFGGVKSSKLDRGDVMKKFVAFAVAAAVAVGSTSAMAQCQSCQQNQVFGQPVYSAPIQSAPVYAAPAYAAPVQPEVAYAAPIVESAPAISYDAAPVASAPIASGCCGCSACGGGIVELSLIHI